MKSADYFCSNPAERQTHKDTQLTHTESKIQSPPTTTGGGNQRSL